MNCVKEVAKLLGVEMYEKFQIDKRGEDLYRFGEFGLQHYCSDYWYSSPLLDNIISGQYNVIKLTRGKNPILTDKEKDYLSFVIAPFKEDIRYIIKWPVNDTKEFIVVELYNEGTISFPPFDKGTRYKGMELQYEYELGELEL